MPDAPGVCCALAAAASDVEGWQPTSLTKAPYVAPAAAVLPVRLLLLLL
jgi:hypothetical protein